jgi:hypothetical protein
MNRIVAGAAFLVGVLFASSASWAVPIDLGTINVGDTVAFNNFANPTAPGSKVNTVYKFTLSADAFLTATDVDLFTDNQPPAGAWDYSTLGIGIWTSDPTGVATDGQGVPTSFTDNIAAAWSSSGATATLSNIVGAGIYYLMVFGKADGTSGGQFLGTVSAVVPGAATTPIPAAGLMLLTGLGALGGIATRRRKTA